MATYEFVAGNTLPVISGILTEDDGTTPVDITNTTITLNISYPTPKIVTATKTVPLEGKFYFPWQTTDLVAGTWDAEIKFVNADGTQTAKRATDNSKFKINVLPNIA